MNCREIRRLEPLYLSGELDGSVRESVSAHLKTCAACNREINEQIRLDSRLAAALAGTQLDSRPLEQRIRLAIASERRVHRWRTGVAIAGLAAGIATAILSSSWLLPSKPVPSPAQLAAAARDHRVEVVEKQPRNWRLAPADIEIVTAGYGLSYEQAASLAPLSYKLQRAKNCIIEGQRTLHLVFGNGAAEYSLYVHSATGGYAPVRVVRQKDQEIGAVETKRFRAIVVTSGSPSECETLIHAAAARL